MTNAVFAIIHLPEASKTGFGQMNIMKKIVWINGLFLINFFYKFGFWSSRWKKLRERLQMQYII